MQVLQPEELISNLIEIIFVKEYQLRQSTESLNKIRVFLEKLVASGVHVRWPDIGVFH